MKFDVFRKLIYELSNEKKSRALFVLEWQREQKKQRTDKLCNRTLKLLANK